VPAFDEGFEEKQEKPQGHITLPLFSPPPRGVKDIVVTQDTSSSPCSERGDEYLSGRANTGGLGEVTTQKNNEQEKPQGH